MSDYHYLVLIIREFSEGHLFEANVYADGVVLLTLDGYFVEQYRHGHLGAI